MSVELKEIKQRIQSTRQIRQVTSALERVSAARLARNRLAIANSQRYTLRLSELLNELLSCVESSSHPLMREPENGKLFVMVFGADRGLCGGFNSSLIEALQTFQEHHEGEELELAVMGKVVARKLSRRGQAVHQQFKQVAPARRADTLEAIVNTMMDGFTHGIYRRAYVLYARFVNALRHEPVVERLLPARPERMAVGSTSPYRNAGFEPTPDVMIARILPSLVLQAFDNAYLNSLGSENAARQATMSRATENAGEILDNLTLSFSRLRQESITTEMIELAGGSIAMA